MMQYEGNSWPGDARNTRVPLGWLALLVVSLLAGCALQVDSSPSSAAIVHSGAASLPTETRRPSPSASPQPRPSHPTGQPVGASQLVSRGPPDIDQIALTFHLGSRVDPGPSIMRWLADNNVPATIFIAGAAVDRSDTDAGREVLELVNERPDLFELGSHGYQAEDLTALGPAQLEQELRRAHSALSRLAKQDPRPLLAPPAGAWNAEVLAAAGQAGYAWSVLWDVDPVDWKPIADGGPTPVQIVDRVLAGVQPGSIVLLQLGGAETLRALPDLVAALRERFQLAVLSDLVGLGPVD